MNFRHPLILASSSPRRQFLMKEAGFRFTIQVPDIDESFPPMMPVQNVPAYLAEKKARVFEQTIREDVVIGSDTVVILEGKIMNKPADRDDAVRMLSLLSNKTHRVITAVCLLSKTKTHCFDDCTEVSFRKITRKEIEFYIDHYHPLDKAGAYGAQDCLPPGLNPCSLEEIDFLRQINKLDLIDKTISPTRTESGVVIIEKIRGSYFTVMGLPIHKLYWHLMQF
jgi:septum formation protein